MGLRPKSELETLLCQSVSDLSNVFVTIHGLLTRLAARFVDRDMFMRYRGGGIGHKYMRAIEETYENMSRERVHHKERKRKGTRSEKDRPDNADDTGSDDGEGEGEPTGSKTGQDAQTGGQDGTSTPPTNTDAQRIPAGGATDDEDDDDDDYIPDSDSCSSWISDSEDLDSDEDGRESYGLGDL